MDSTPNHVNRPSSPGDGQGLLLPDFCIVGAMKSGTTSVARYLSEHPRIFMPEHKEIHFFDRHYRRGTDWYATWFQLAEPTQLKGEATPTYMYEPSVAERMGTVLPDLRVIVCLRDPVARAYSHYWHERARGRERLSFPDAIAAEPERLASGGHAERMHASYMDRGHYIRQLERLAWFYPRSAIHVLFLEELLEDPVREYRSVCHFLAVQEEFVPANLGVRYNPGSNRLSRLVRRGSSRLPPPFSRLARVVQLAEPRYPAMSETIKKQLDAKFSASNEALARWLGRRCLPWA